MILFVFQQAQASTGILSNNKSNSSHSSLVQANGLPTQVYVTMLRLDIRNGTPLEDPTTYEYIKCLLGDFAYGCTEDLNYGVTSTEYYPYGNINPVMVDVESDYLPNVLPREMDVRGNSPTLAALQAQALAARSIADWKYRANFVNYGYNYIDNSTNNQVFVPYSYKYYAPNDVVRQLISDAITSTNGQYLYSQDTGDTVDAEFGSDAGNHTSPKGKSYLIGVDDSISITNSTPACGNGSNYSGWGMSQKGALRWSNGNRCATGGDASTKWPVTWSDYRQILVHYYTGIDILNASEAKVAPDDRWNMLKHDNFGESIGLIPRLASGGNYAVQIMLQNTSTLDWSGDDMEIGYHWGDQIWHVSRTLPSGS